MVLVLLLTSFVNSNAMTSKHTLLYELEFTDSFSTNNSEEFEHPIKQYYRVVELNDNINILNVENKLSPGQITLNNIISLRKIRSSFSISIVNNTTYHKVPIYIKGHSLRH